MDDNNLLAVVPIFVLLLCLLPTSVNSVFSYQIASVSVEPSTNDVRIGGNFTIDVNASDVDDLYSFEFKLYYKTTVLDGLSVAFPSPWPLTSQSEIVDSLGYVWVNSSLMEPPGIVGNVTLASITFHATAVGDSILDIYIINFANSTGGLIPLISRDGSATVTWNIKVPEDYPTIQEGINAAKSGDIVFVSSNMYYEHVIVNKTVTLMGESKENTIIDGNGTETVVTMTVPNIEVKGFTIQNGGDFPHCGVLVSSCNGNIISNNIIRNNYNGLELHQSNGSNVFDNTITNNSNAAIYISYSSDNIVVSNAILDNSIGAWISSSYTPNTLHHNNFIDNTNQVQDDGTNVWDDGWEGNYWSDYNGTDSNEDGIGDTFLPWQGVDYKPLMNPYMECDINRDTRIDYHDIRLFCMTYIEYWTAPVGKKSGYELVGYPVELLMYGSDLNEDCCINVSDVRCLIMAYIDYWS